MTQMSLNERLIVGKTLLVPELAVQARERAERAREATKSALNNSFYPAKEFTAREALLAH